MNNKVKTGLFVIFLLSLLFFNQPLLGIASGLSLGVPAPMLYLGVVWLVLIILIRWSFSKTDQKKERQE